MSDLIFPRRRPYWFQEEGFFDTKTGAWTPYRSLPLFFEAPGPVNVYERPDANRFSKRDLERMEKRWNNVLWPHISRAMRQMYVEKKRPSLRRFRDALWDQLEPVTQFETRTNGVISGNRFRLDKYGNVIARRAQRSSMTSWDVDHIVPFSRGGLSQLANLQALQHRANQIIKKDRFETFIHPWKFRVGISVEKIQQMLDAGKSAEKVVEEITTRQARIHDEIRAHRKLVAREIAFLTQLCDACGKAQSKFVCSQCRAYQFCSQTCAEREWAHENGTHAKYCDLMKPLH